ncbi:MAG: hypothetical protein ACI3VB_00175 [Oscillospiraceae bacterium]
MNMADSARLGVSLGAVLLAFAGQGLIRTPVAAFFLIYYLSGCSLWVLATGRTNLMSLLSERE